MMMTIITYDELLARAEEFAREYYHRCKENPLLLENHVRLVRGFAITLADLEGADKQVVELAALFHDIGRYKGREEHHVHGYEIAKTFLETVELPVEKKELILKCIVKHRYRFAFEDNEIEVKIVQSADALGTLFDDIRQEKYQKTMSKEALLKQYQKVIQKINLISAKNIAQKQLEKLKNLLD